MGRETELGLKGQEMVFYQNMDIIYPRGLSCHLYFDKSEPIRIRRGGGMGDEKRANQF